MDTLVARYSRPSYQQNEAFSEQEQQDLADAVPSFSLKFAMPPVAHVGVSSSLFFLLHFGTYSFAN
jgi:hypothetical protein